MALYDDNPTVCQTRFGNQLDPKVEQTNGQPSQPTTPDDAPFDEELKSIRIEIERSELSRQIRAQAQRSGFQKLDTAGAARSWYSPRDDDGGPRCVSPVSPSSLFAASWPSTGSCTTCASSSSGYGEEIALHKEASLVSSVRRRVMTSFEGG